MAVFDYQAGDDDEISFNPNDVITHIEMVITCIVLSTSITLRFRLMPVGGAVAAMDNSACSLRTMSSCAISESDSTKYIHFVTVQAALQRDDLFIEHLNITTSSPLTRVLYSKTF